MNVKVTLIPKELAKRDAELGSRGYHTWAKARESNDFRALQQERPHEMLCAASATASAAAAAGH